MVIVGTGPGCGGLFAGLGGPAVGVSSDSLSSPIPKSSSRSSQTSARRLALGAFALDGNEDFASEPAGWELKRGRSCVPDGPASSSEKSSGSKESSVFRGRYKRAIWRKLYKKRRHGTRSILTSLLER